MATPEKQRLGSSPATSIKFTKRLWVIPPVLLLFYLITRLVAPSDPGEYTRQLTPHNYFATDANQTLYDLPNPFAFCPTGGKGDTLNAKYGQVNLARSVIHAGSGARVQKVLRRAMAGLPVTISVLGGSVSACHGAGDDPIAPACWPARFFNWWNQVFPHPASELTNGAMRNTDSRYYAFCHSHHVPDRTDLIILDFDSTDTTEPENAAHFELLLRALLIRVDNPAVVILGHFAPQYQDVHGFGGPEVTHAALAQFYDVPHVSTKPFLYHPYVTTPDSVKQQFFADPMLSNPHGHAVLADTLSAYFQSQACQVWTSTTSHEMMDVVEPGGVGGAALGGVGIRKGDIGGNAGAGAVGVGEGKAGAGAVGAFLGGGGLGMHDHRPPPYMSHTRTHNLHNFREVEPFCVSANDLINPLPPSLFSGSGWHGFHPHTSGSHRGRHDGSEDEHYWYSTLPMSRLKVPIRLGAGDVGVFYMREPVAEGRNSAVKCCVDDNYGGAVLIENADPGVDRPKPGLVMIDRSVARGSHNVECVLQGEEDTGVPPFKIIGIFAT